MKRLGLVFVLAGCVTTAPVQQSDAPSSGLSAALEKLPACAPGADVGVIKVKATACTRKFCQDPCCNQCSYAATFENKSGQPVPLAAERLKELLALPVGGLDCEIAGWNQTLSSQSVSVDGAGCVVR